MSALLSTVQSLPESEREEVERALVPLARDALIGRLAGAAAHDAGNSLFGLVGLVDLLLEGEPLPAERVALLRRAAGDLEATVKPLLQLARPGRGDLAAAAEQAVAVAHRGRVVADGPRPVACPGELVVQAVLHLVCAAGDEPTLDLSDGVLRVTPAGEPSLDEVIARRIALDHDGSLERDGGSYLLRLPAA
jgi:hypothetical protein